MLAREYKFVLVKKRTTMTDRTWNVQDESTNKKQSYGNRQNKCKNGFYLELEIIKFLNLILPFISLNVRQKFKNSNRRLSNCIRRASRYLALKVALVLLVERPDAVPVGPLRVSVNVHLDHPALHSLLNLRLHREWSRLLKLN
jgi:hypothetical protein